MLRRACRLSTEFATATKRHKIARVLETYRGAVNFCVRSLWQDFGALDKETLARLPPERTRLQSMHKDQALRQARAIVSSTRRSAKALGAKPQRPRFTGMAVLCHGVTIEPGRGSFDLVVRLSTLASKRTHHHPYAQDPRAHGDRIEPATVSTSVRHRTAPRRGFTRARLHHQHPRGFSPLVHLNE
jgi:hypothetical protein